jgi:hypothetical protein
MVLQSLQGLPAFIAYFCLATVKDAHPIVISIKGLVFGVQPMSNIQAWTAINTCRCVPGVACRLE